MAIYINWLPLISNYKVESQIWENLGPPIKKIGFNGKPLSQTFLELNWFGMEPNHQITGQPLTKVWNLEWNNKLINLRTKIRPMKPLRKINQIFEGYKYHRYNLHKHMA